MCCCINMFLSLSFEESFSLKETIGSERGRLKTNPFLTVTGLGAELIGGGNIRLCLPCCVK